MTAFSDSIIHNIVMTQNVILSVTQKSIKMKSKCFNALLLVFAFSVIATVSCTAQTSKEQPQTAAQTQQTIKLKVSGITCTGDCKDIQKVVSKMNGVTSCKQVGKPTATSVFEVIFNPAVITEKEIRKAVEDTPGCDNPDEKPYKVKQG